MQVRQILGKVFADWKREEKFCGYLDDIILCVIVYYDTGGMDDEYILYRRIALQREKYSG